MSDALNNAAKAGWTPPTGTPAARALAHVTAGSAGPPIDRALRVTLNFHPDRLHRGMPILGALAADGVYRSQFETGTSNGGLTAHPGGDRWEWESRIFGTAYDAAPPTERPKYGALNYRQRPTGGSPRFGSAHLRLRSAVLDRSTFCFPDSAFGPADFGVASLSRFSSRSMSSRMRWRSIWTGALTDMGPGYLRSRLRCGAKPPADCAAWVRRPPVALLPWLFGRARERLPRRPRRTA